jgi:hypothetical protein
MSSAVCRRLQDETRELGRSRHTESRSEAEQQLPYDDNRQEHLFRAPHLLGDEFVTPTDETSSSRVAGSWYATYDP